MSEGAPTVGGMIRHGLYRHALPYRNAEDPLRLTETVLRYDVAMLANGVSKIFLYSMGDIDFLGSHGSFRSLVATDGSRHPSAHGRASLAWHIEGLKSDRMLRIKDGVYAYLFGDDTRSVAILCPRPGHGALPLPVAPGPVARDLFCNSLPPEPQLGEQSIPLATTVKQVRIALRIRSANVKLGDADWQAPGLNYSWLLADKTERQIGPGSWILLKHPVENWTPLETILSKPENAVGIKVCILGIGCTGQADFDDITVQPFGSATTAGLPPAVRG